MSGPATIKDVAHHFGARQRDASAWLEGLSDEISHVTCGDRKGLLLLRKDEKTLMTKAPAKWPLRLMPQWDTYLMDHADKSWTVPDAAERKIVWRGSAVVAAAVLYRGRVVAEWNHDVRGGTLDVRIIPLSRFKSAHLPAVKREAKIVAAHLGLEKAHVSV